MSLDFDSSKQLPSFSENLYNGVKLLKEERESMPDNQSYALWIIPTDDAYALTSGYIGRLSRLYDLPAFEPHVTVLGGIRSPETAEMRDLAESLAPFRIRLAREVEYREAYFRCLFLQAYKTEELGETYWKASALFGNQGSPYFPHLSLAYGNLPVWKKQEMIAELGPIPKIEFEARAVSLVEASSEKPISKWSVIEQFPLQKRK